MITAAAIYGLVAIVIVTSHELIASPRQIVEAVSEAVPGFGCEEISVETPSGS